VRKDVLARLEEKSTIQGYVHEKFGESRDKAGNFAYLSIDEETKILNTLELVETQD